MIWNSKRTLLLTAGLLLFAVAPACTGFFVNPTLSSLTIGPQAQTITANPKQTLQMSATGNYSDGSTKDLTGKVSWSSSDTTCATINSAGLVSPAASVSGICTATISAASGTVSAATTTVMVSEGTPTSIMLSFTPNPPLHNSTVTFKALATFPNNNTQQDITTSVTWLNSDTTNLQLTNGSATGTLSAGSGGLSITVQAQFDNVQSNQVTLNVQ